MKCYELPAKPGKQMRLDMYVQEGCWIPGFCLPGPVHVLCLVKGPTVSILFSIVPK